MSVLRVIVLSGAFASVVAALPLSFEQRSALQFRTQLHGMPVTIGPNVVSFGSIRLRFEGASAQVRLAGIGKPVPATYVSARARQTFRQYPKLALRHLYPGVDAVFYGNGSELEYDLTFQPGARAEDLRLSFEGARGLRIDDDGNLVIQSQAETVTQKAPHAYQADGTGIDTHFVLVSRFTVGLRVGRHDPKQPMTIDPQLVYSSTLGSSKGIGPSLVATDSQGNIYLAGRGNPGGFPGTSDASADIAVPLLALSNAAGSAVSFTIGNAETVNAIGGSPDGSTLYAATPGAIYSSIDDGATWTPAGPLPLPTPAISGIAVDPGNAARVFLATSQGIFFSGDGGQTWALNNPAAVSWVTMSRDSSLAYATSATTLYQSSDGGVTWNVLNPGGLSPAIAAVALDGSALYVITQAGSLFESSDAGSTWTALGTGPAMAQTLLVDPTNASNVYVLAASNIFKSTDGGFTFKTSLFQTTTANKALQITLDSTGTLFVAGQLPTGDIWIYASPDQVQWVPKAETPNLHSLVTIGNRVFAGFDATSNTFVTKLDPTGTQILYSTFLGGSSVQLSGLQVDAQGN
ncbi:MAG TPA: hypothetical protein VGL72_33130, partial [Bryobacteraceae bacterium]